MRNEAGGRPFRRNQPGGSPFRTLEGTLRMRRAPVLAIAILVLGCGPREPLHNGKPASYWKQALHDPDAQVRREAITALGALHVTDMVPELTADLKDRDANVRARAAEAL